MGASISWSPVKKDKHLPVATPSAFIEALRLPRILEPSEINWLDGVRRGRPDWDIPISILIEMIEMHGPIRVDVSY